MPGFDEFDAILCHYLDGSITADELAELEAKLLADTDFAAHFSRWCLLHRQIGELLTESTLHEIMDQFATGTGSLPKSMLKQAGSQAKTPIAPPAVGGASTEIPPGPTILSRWLLWGGLAAATLLLAVWLLTHSGNRHRSELAGQRAPPGEGENQEIVATLTQLVDGVWEPKATVLQPGQLLAKGSRILLKSGMAKVTFECGAEVVLQGPCDFEIQSQMVGYLRSGKITANVPHRAFSFAILSPQVDFVDLGTAFGVNVGAGGKTELHVFEGEVLCSPAKKDAAEHKEPLHVTASSAVAFATGGYPSNIAIDKEQFSSLIDLRRTADGGSQRLDGDRLALWLTADLGVTTDARGRVVSWQDILYGDNRSAEDATQEDEKARPSLVPNAISGHPAVRFDGQSDFLVTTPLETTDDQTVLLVCQFSPSAYDKSRRWGGQILNYDGPPSREAHGYLSNTLQPGVLQIGEPLLAEEFKPTLLTGQVFAGFVGSATVESGRVDAGQVGADTPVVVSYVYDHAGARATLSINGRACGEARAFAPQAITSRKIIGRHSWKQNFFHGDLAELLIYNQAMSAADLAKTTSYLADKYSIALEPGSSVKQEVDGVVMKQEAVK